MGSAGWCWVGARFFRLWEPPRRRPPKTSARSLPLQTRHGLAARSGAGAATSPFGLLLCSREFLQSHIATAGPPSRESGVRAAPATVSTRAPAPRAPRRASPASAAAAAARSARADRSPSAPRLAQSREPDAAAASQPLKDKGPARGAFPAERPANHLQPHLHTRRHWLCKSACSDNSAPARGTGLSGAEGGGATLKASRGGRGGARGRRGLKGDLRSCRWGPRAWRKEEEGRPRGALERAAKCFSSWCTFFFLLWFHVFCCSGLLLKSIFG